MIRLNLAGITVLGLCMQQVSAQDVVPAAQDLLVVPAVVYEPGRPRAARPSPSLAPLPITPIGFQEAVEPMPQAPPLDCTEKKQLPPCFWVRAEYLSWRVSDAPIRVPLITTNAPPAIGAIDELGTRVLFGAGAPNDARYGTVGGMRLTVGGWLEKDYEYSWEATGFFLERRGFQASAGTPGGAAATVSIPFNATQAFNLLNPAGETALTNGGAPARATVDLTTQLWGFELNELAFLYGSKHFYVNAVLGFRYVQLNENLTLTHTSLDTIRNGELSVVDGFGTRNQFFGAQLGARVGTAWHRWTFDSSAVVAVGPIRQTVNVVGATSVSNGAFGFTNGTTDGGVFAQPSNSGRSRRDVLAVVPELQFKVGFDVAPWCRPFFGYDVMYVNAVARPGNQIERDVNPTQNAFFVPPGTLVGAASPTATIRSSDYFAHGLQFGVELRY